MKYVKGSVSILNYGYYLRLYYFYRNWKIKIVSHILELQATIGHRLSNDDIIKKV